MQKCFLLFAACFVFFLLSACQHKTTLPIHHTNGLIGLALLVHQTSQPGLPGILSSIDEVTAKGINLFGMAPEWPELEPSPNVYSFQDPIINPLTLTDPASTKFRSYILVIKMIDTERKLLPANLADSAFNSPAVILRFDAMLDSLSHLPSFSRVSHILIGNEVDGYLTTHPAELPQFAAFYTQVVAHLHTVLLSVKVGTIVTFNSLQQNPAIFNTLNPISDFACFTYYPTNNATPNWQMRPPTEAAADIAFMAGKAAGKPFAFTEIGYPSATANASSEAAQAQFVQTMFNALRAYDESKQLTFLFYHGLYDYAPGECSAYAQAQGIDSTYLCGFMNSLGLKNFTSREPKEAWATFTNNLAVW